MQGLSISDDLRERLFNNNNSQYLYRNVQFSKASLNGVLFL